MLSIKSDKKVSNEINLPDVYPKKITSIAKMAEINKDELDELYKNFYKEEQKNGCPKEELKNQALLDIYGYLSSKTRIPEDIERENAELKRIDEYIDSGQYEKDLQEAYDNRTEAEIIEDMESDPDCIQYLNNKKVVEQYLEQNQLDYDQEQISDNYKIFHTVKIGKLILTFNKKDKEICAKFPIEGGTAKLFSKQTSISYHQVKVEIKNEEKFSFKIGKIISAIGSNRNSTYYALLYDRMKAANITPNYGEKDFTGNFKKFILDLQTANGDVNEVINSPQWQLDEGTPKQSWFEINNKIETFDPSIYNESREILKDGIFIDYAVDTISRVVRMQQPKITLAFLIGMSSILNDVLNSLAVASPGKSKSMICENVYEVFPEHRRFEFNTESSVAGLINMTKYTEGNEIFKGKLVYLGDLGNENEQKNPKVQELLTVFKQLMSRKRYTKIITDMQNDEGLPVCLELIGCGAVLVECTSQKLEAQFEDRSVRWSPEDGKKIREGIRAYQADELEKLKSERLFDEKRPVIACGIEQIFNLIENYSKNGFKILNPYGEFMFELFNLDDEIGHRNDKHLLIFPKLVTLTNIFQRTIYINKETNMNVAVVTPDDFLDTLMKIGKSIAYMLSPVPENILTYIDLIEEYYLQDQDWTYTFDDYQVGFRGNLDKVPQGEFDQFILNCKPIYAQDVADKMSVQSSTARKYLNNLAQYKILYKKAENGKQNIYYPISDFNAAKDDIRTKFLKPDEIKKLKNKVQLIYDEFIVELKNGDFKEAQKKL